MLFTKNGLPEEDEIVICTVKKILHNSIFVSLDEYQKAEGMLHISEIAPGRIRNIRDYVKPNKKIVCKVLRVDTKYNHVDLSLRRVSLSLKQRKTEEYKQELRSEKLIVNLAKQNKISDKDSYEKLIKPLIEKFGSLNLAFTDVLKNGEKNLKDIEKPLAEILVKMVKEKTKLPEVKIEAVIKLTDYNEDGVNKIKEIFKKSIKLSEEKKYRIEYNYISAPKYRLKIKAGDYKEAETILEKTIENLKGLAKESKTILEWEKKS